MSQTMSPAFRESRRLVLAGVVVNIVLAVVKVAGGVWGNSAALLADGLESSLDVLSSGLIWAALKYAERPPDEDHPYGHGKMESLAAMAGSVLLLAAGGALAWRSAGDIWDSFFLAPGYEDLPQPFTLGILLVTILSKEILFRVFSHRGKILGSSALSADAWHHRSDAITSLAALVGISLALIGGPGWAKADDWAALFSCAIILFNGWKMLMTSMGESLDKQEPGELRAHISSLAARVPGVTSVEKIRVRKSGLSRIADLHVRVDGDISVREGHVISHAVKDALQAGGFQLSDITVHIEPEYPNPSARD